jgi:3-amino-5-hydroxybenzoate synthase
VMTRLALRGGPRSRTTPFPPWPPASPATRQALITAHDQRRWWQDGSSAAEDLEAWLGGEFSRPAITTCSGTTALEIALRALGIGPGDEVLVPAATFISTASAVTQAGAAPVPVDVRPQTLTLDTDHAASAVNGRTRAVISVHLAGHPADPPGVAAFARRHDLAVIEDSAQAVTASWDGTRVASTADAAILSFQQAKLLPGGDGGALLVRDAAAARRAEMIANCGRPRGSGSYDHQLIGTNARISVFAAALVLAQAPALERMWQLRDRRRAQLAAALAQAGHDSLLIGPHPRVTRHDHYAVLMRTPDVLTERGIHATTLAAALTAEGIPAKALFPPWQATPAYAASPRCAAIRTPHAEHAAATVIALPHPLLLDPHVADDTTTALTKVTACPGDLLAWQDEQRHRPAPAVGVRS